MAQTNPSALKAIGAALAKIPVPERKKYEIDVGGKSVWAEPEPPPAPITVGGMLAGTPSADDNFHEEYRAQLSIALTILETLGFVRHDVGDLSMDNAIVWATSEQAAYLVNNLGRAIAAPDNPRPPIVYKYASELSAEEQDHYTQVRKAIERVIRKPLAQTGATAEVAHLILADFLEDFRVARGGVTLRSADVANVIIAATRWRDDGLGRERVFLHVFKDDHEKWAVPGWVMPSGQTVLAAARLAVAEDLGPIGDSLDFKVVPLNQDVMEDEITLTRGVFTHYRHFGVIALPRKAWDLTGAKAKMKWFTLSEVKSGKGRNGEILMQKGGIVNQVCEAIEYNAALLPEERIPGVPNPYFDDSFSRQIKAIAKMVAELITRVVAVSRFGAVWLSIAFALLVSVPVLRPLIDRVLDELLHQPNIALGNLASLIQIGLFLFTLVQALRTIRKGRRH